jgi:predicted DNA-binding transcriptional regulator YafY
VPATRGKKLEQSVEKRLSWGAEQRLEFIEFRLFWDGVLNRSDITERFGVSVPQASNDLAAYRELAPANLEYDSSAKCYVSKPAFKPRFLKPNPDRYLAQLKAISDGILDLADTWISQPPSSGVLPVPGRRIDAEVLRSLLIAVRGESAIQIEYQSMSPENPAPLWRWITPHAFGFDGFRWHVRAFCHRRAEFRDFIVGRCFAAARTRPAAARSDDDWKWHTLFDVVLEPNPELAEGQKGAIALDYGMSDGRLTVPVRYALLYYFNKRLRLDVGADLDGPQERPVIVANRTQFDEALAKAAGKPQTVKVPADEPPSF